ncbi:MAG: hypothetical protein FWC16_09450 [Defluviitaleaceae bacterium]|nr:hypothetical protein [Defluviitaleaceae bacterium]MCL2275137.1 hypothetical protein [Defluviitaleaceae bacterium]
MGEGKKTLYLTVLLSISLPVLFILIYIGYLFGLFLWDYFEYNNLFGLTHLNSFIVTTIVVLLITVTYIYFATQHIMKIGYCKKYTVRYKCKMIEKCPDCRTYKLPAFLGSLFLLLPFPIATLNWGVASQDMLGNEMHFNIIHINALNNLTSTPFLILTFILLIINIVFTLFKTRQVLFSIFNYFVQLATIYIMSFLLIVGLIYLQALLWGIVFILFLGLILLRFIFGSRRRD